MKHIFALAGLLAVCASNAQVTWHDGALPLPYRDLIVWELVEGGEISASQTSYWNKAVEMNQFGGIVITRKLLSHNVGYVQVGTKIEEGSYDYLWYGPPEQYGVQTNDFESLELTTPVAPGARVHRIAYVVNPDCLAYPEDGDESGLLVGRLYTEMRIDARVLRG